jgi:hypothetical protein
MRKIAVIFLCVLLGGLLAACTPAAAATTAGSQASGAATAAPADGTPAPGSFQISNLTRLLLASFKLEGTPQAITPAQAKTLVPLWQAVVSLGQSDTTAPAELTAVEQQIQGTFTAEQLSAIDAMALTQADVRTIMTEQGITFGGGRNGTPPPGANGTPFPGGGGFTGGGGRGGGGGGGGGGTGFNPQNLSPEQQATLQARRAAGGAGRRGAGVPAPLVQALIKLLQTKAA